MALSKGCQICHMVVLRPGLLVSLEKANIIISFTYYFWSELAVLQGKMQVWWGGPEFQSPEMYRPNFYLKSVQEKPQNSGLGTCMCPDLTMLEPHEKIWCMFYKDSTADDLRRQRGLPSRNIAGLNDISPSYISLNHIGQVFLINFFPWWHPVWVMESPIEPPEVHLDFDEI